MGGTDWSSERRHLHHCGTSQGSLDLCRIRGRRQESSEMEAIQGVVIRRDL